MATSRPGRVEGKVALVTGGAGGQGAVHCRMLAEEGARVVMADITAAAGEAAAAALAAAGLAVRYLHLDVTRPEDWQRAVRATDAWFGRLDVLVNNAGISSHGDVLACTLEEWNATIAVNQTGTFLGMKIAVPLMRRGGGGSIINVSSVLGTLGTDFGIAYHATKAAVHLLTRAAAVTLAPEIGVNTLTPGIVALRMRDGLDGERLKDRLAAYPMGRAAQPEEVSRALLFLASDESSFTTGCELKVDGGALAGVKGRKPS